jgi:PAS domain S-box-containing protein
MQCASQLLSARPGVAADTEAAYLLRVVRSGCALMLAIINDVLELKRLEDEAANGAQPVASAPRRGCVLLRDAFEASLEVCRVACSRRVHWAAEEDPKALPPVLEGSPERVQQLLHDLLIAAARFCAPDAQIEATISCEPVQMAEPGSALGDVELRVQLFVPHAPLSASQLRAAFDLHDPAQTDEGAAIALGLGTARATARAKGGDATLASDATAGGLRLEARARLFSPGSAAHSEASTSEGGAPSPRTAAASASAAVARGLFKWDTSVTTPHALTATDVALRDPASVAEPPPASALRGGSPPLSPSSTLSPRSPPSQALVARMFAVLTTELDQAFKVAEKREDGRVVYVYASPSMTHMYGWKPADMMGRDVRDFHHPDDLEAPPLKQVLTCEVPEDKSQQPEGHVDDQTGTVRATAWISRPVCACLPAFACAVLLHLQAPVPPAGRHIHLDLVIRLLLRPPRLPDVQGRARAGGQGGGAAAPAAGGVARAARARQRRAGCCSAAGAP